MTTVRIAVDSDRAALDRLAGRDSARLPDGRLLVAIERGELRAAMAIADGTTIADPFWPTARLVAALRAFAGDPAAARARPAWRRAGLRGGVGLAR